MIVLRCTQRLLAKRSIPVDAHPPEPANPFGEWYANAVALPFPGRWIVMYTNSTTLLTVLTPGRGLKTTLPIFRERMPALLQRLQLAPEWINAQREALAEVVVARTSSRRVLGSMNDLAFHVRVTAEAAPSFDSLDFDRLELDLAGVLLSMLEYRDPRAATEAIARGSTGSPPA